MAREQIILKECDAVAVQKLSQELSVCTVVGTILFNRGLRTAEQCERFFNPRISDLHDPYLFQDMDIAVKRILRSVANKEKIVVYGDYDVDGVTATVLMIRLLRHLGANCSYYLPNRLTHGYGISMVAMEELCDGEVSLIISVDCGITAIEEIRYAASRGVDIIVTDHHQPKEQLPCALALLNPKLSACGYPDDNLAGVGVAFKLCMALVDAAGVDKQYIYRYLDLVALGTAADIVPLIGENRIIVAKGFEQMRNSNNLGLRHLIKIQGLEEKILSTSDVVFHLAPCINAAGRLGDPKRGVELLLTEDEALARLYAAELRQANQQRRILDKSVQDEAFEWVEKNCDLDNDYVIVSGSHLWHCGVIGIAASKVVERFHRPAVLFSIDENGIARGSGRSIPAFHLTEALRECSPVLDSYGGHAAAAGLCLRKERIEEFRKLFNSVARRKLSASDLMPKIIADVQITLDQITPHLYDMLKKMEPFGPANMRPIFLCRQLRHRYEPRIVGTNHLKMVVTNKVKSIDAIAFGLAERFEEIKYSSTFSLAFVIDENQWNGTNTLQMRVKGIEL